MNYFGIDWDIDIQRYGNRLQYGEVTWTSRQYSPLNGGQFLVLHDDEDGTFSLHEMGGSGPNVWDRDIEDRLSSPLVAFAKAEAEQRRQEDTIRSWESEQ